MAILAILCLPTAMLIFTAIACVLPSAVASIGTAGPHGFSEILYAYTSTAANNGSAFGGLTGNTPWYNITLGISLLMGRFLVIIPALAIAGSLVTKKRVPSSAGTFPTDGPLFVGLLIGTILVVGGHVPHRWTAVRRPAGRYDRDRRGSHLLPGAGARTGDRAPDDDRWPDLLRPVR